MSQPIRVDDSGNLVLKINWHKAIKVIVIIAAAWISYYLDLPGLTTASRICLALFVGAAGLWVTEAIQPFATATIVIVLSIYLLGFPGGPLNLDASGIESSYRIFLNYPSPAFAPHHLTQVSVI